MKELFAVILSALIVCSFAACGQAKTSQTAETTAQAATKAEESGKEEVIAGGFTDAESPVLDDAAKEVVAKATETLTGVGYTPVAYVGSQIVAGVNHLILCKATPTVPDAKTTYALVKIYEDPQGKAEITDVQECDAEAPSDSTEMTGAYTEPETPVVTEEAKAALSKALEGLDGADYQAKALLGTQVVAGTNYLLFCKITPVTEKPVSSYAVVTVYENTDGTAEITETHDFAAAKDAPAADEEQAQTSQG